MATSGSSPVAVAGVWFIFGGGGNERACGLKTNPPHLMPPKDAAPVLTPSRRNGIWLALIALTLILAFLFRASFKPGQTLFSNDGPLAALQAEPLKLPEGFTGAWQRLTWGGTHGGSALLDL